MSRDDLPSGENGPFEHLRKKLDFDGETFPARFAQIFWNYDETSGANHQVSVCFVPRNIEGFDFMKNRNDAFLKICADAFFDPAER